MKKSDPFRMPAGLEFPVRNIFCIGRNYAEHAKELKNEVPAEPVVFIKPTSSLAFDGEPIVIPSYTKKVHHELEVVIAIGRQVKNELPDQSLDAITAVALGIDVTARDLQDQLKSKGLPWTLAKGLDTFAALSTFYKVASPREQDWNNLQLELSVNGELRQKGNTAEMLFSIPALISFLSHRFTLNQGDLIYTGTPAGVGILSVGDKLESRLYISGHQLEWRTDVM